MSKKTTNQELRTAVSYSYVVTRSRPYLCQVEAVSGWRLGTRLGNGGLGEPRPTLIASLIHRASEPPCLWCAPRVPVSPCPRAPGLSHQPNQYFHTITMAAVSSSQ
jgi:hypothetical protein